MKHYLLFLETAFDIVSPCLLLSLSWWLQKSSHLHADDNIVGIGSLVFGYFKNYHFYLKFNNNLKLILYQQSKSFKDF